MGLEQDGITIASHVTMITVLILLIGRILRSELGGVIGVAVREHEFTIFICLGAAAFAIERAYYVAARLLKGKGVDLWAAHPGPEVLSMLVALAAYAGMAPIIMARASSRSAGLQRIGIEVAALAGLCAGLAWILW